MKLGFLANDDSEQDEISDSDWISTEDGEEDKEEISLFDSSSEAEMVTNFAHLLLPAVSFPKPKCGKQHLLQIMLVEQLRTSFDEVQDQQGFQNLWTICDSTCSYTWKMQVYIREDTGLARETKQGTRVVFDLAEDTDISCRNITCDNFFTNLCSYAISGLKLSQVLQLGS